MPPAIANAIYRACGVRVREAPITPERLWRAMLTSQPRGEDDV
jgi:CO/xanthine dehydrogenase Mo-binding subunit